MSSFVTKKLNLGYTSFNVHLSPYSCWVDQCGSIISWIHSELRGTTGILSQIPRLLLQI